MGQLHDLGTMGDGAATDDDDQIGLGDPRRLGRSITTARGA
jgi:hypothetical protein